MNQPTPQLYQIRNDKLDTWHDWCRQLMTRYRDEAAKIINNEGLFAEWFVEFEVDGSNYVVGAMLASDFKGTISHDTTDTLSAQHKKILKECLIKVSSADYAYLIKI